MNIDIKGHSGCNIDIIESDDGHLYVRKSSKDKKYLNRLSLQCQKQYTDCCLSNTIKTPQIYDKQLNEEECYFVMDYIYAKNFIDYFESASLSDIDHFIDSFTKYIDKELSFCEIKKISKSIFIDKFKSVKENCKKNALLNNDRVTKVLKNCEDIFYNKIDNELTIPVGQCHGDLTFSNILFTSNNYYFIDYLDSFIETPIQDIVKLRQDTKYFWSTLMYSKKYDVIRLNMIFDYIDTNIHHYYQSYNLYKDNYDTLQLMNILRILPYVKETKVLYFVLNILESLIEKFINK